VPNLLPGAIVVMDNLSSHKSDSIIPMIEAVGASVLFLSSYSPDFNPYAFGWAKPYELWWSQLKSFLRMFSPTTTIMENYQLPHKHLLQLGFGDEPLATTKEDGDKDLLAKGIAGVKTV
jgi:hypothetical protein